MPEIHTLIWGLFAKKVRTHVLKVARSAPGISNSNWCLDVSGLIHTCTILYSFNCRKR